MGVFFQGREKILGIARKINSLQRQYGIQTAVDYEEEFKFNLMEVVFEWARGMVNMFINQLYNKFLLVIYGPLWPWSYGIWIYNYLCNQCLSPLMLWVQILIRARCTTLCDKVCRWLTTGRWFSPGFLYIQVKIICAIYQ